MKISMPKKANEQKTPEQPTILENIDQSEWAALKVEAKRLHKLAQQEEVDFNEFQQQREKLNYFWIVEKKRLDDKKAELRSKQREIQDLQERHEYDIKIEKQKLKHVIYENQNELSQRKIGSKILQKVSLDEHLRRSNTMKASNHTLQKNLNEVNLQNEECIRQIKFQQDQRITELRHDFERQANEIQLSYDNKLLKRRDELEKTRRAEIKKIENSKETHVQNLSVVHQLDFVNIKEYFNDITHNNLDLIKTLKDEVKELEEDEKKDQSRLFEKSLQNKKISVPLLRLKDENAKLSSQLENYQQEKSKMKEIKASLCQSDNELSALAWEHETLLQKLILLKTERDKLRVNLRIAVHDIKQKSSFQTKLLEKKVAILEETQALKRMELTVQLNNA